MGQRIPESRNMGKKMVRAIRIAVDSRSEKAETIMPRLIPPIPKRVRRTKTITIVEWTTMWKPKIAMRSIRIVWTTMMPIAKKKWPMD